jgi:hypothetical protein
MRLQANVRLIEAIRDAHGEAEAYVDGKCAVECVRDRATQRDRTTGRGGLALRAHNISLTGRTRSTRSIRATRGEQGAFPSTT